MKLLKNDAQPARLSDYAVVKRVLDGEKELFEILMRRNNQTLYRAVRSYITSEADIQDLMQDSYLKAYRKLHQFKGDAKFSTWLVRIGINEALQRIRKQKGNRVENIEGDEHILQRAESKQMNPENKVIHNEMSRLIEEAIDQLPEKYRAVYVLREVEGMTNREISSCLELTDSNVKVRFHRAKNLLKDRLYELSSDKSIYEFGNERCDRLVVLVMELI